MVDECKMFIRPSFFSNISILYVLQYVNDLFFSSSLTFLYFFLRSRILEALVYILGELVLSA